MMGAASILALMIFLSQHRWASTAEMRERRAFRD